MAIGKAIGGFLTFVWNSKTREFLGRDGASWAKISFFYAIFYTILGSFFVGMLAVFYQTLDAQKPTYYDRSSIMNIAKDFESGKARVNPALGFRPQLDPESALITYSLSKIQDKEASGDFARINKTLHQFFERYYNRSDGSLIIDNCKGRNISDVRIDLKEGKHCKFDYEALFKEIGTPDDDPFTIYNSLGPLVVLKLNKIYTWLPKPYDFENMESLPGFLRDLKAKNSDNPEKLKKLENIVKNNVMVKCTGEYTSDVDSIEKFDMKYYSASDDSHEFIKDFGVFPFYYYPYLNQKHYESPLVFLQFNAQKHTDVLTNILCRAYAANIDSDDKLNRRGMTEFILYVRK